MIRQVFLLLFLPLFVRSQDLPPALQQRLEQRAESTGGEEPDEALLSSLEALRRHPLDLNRAGREELAELHLLGEAQVEAFLRYCEALGPLVSIYELQAIPGWDLSLIRTLLPYVRIGPPPLSPALWRKGKPEQTLICEAQRRLGTDTTRDRGAGDGWHAELKYRLSLGTGVWAGLTLEKDAGERWWGRGGARGPDFCSAHLFWKPGRGLKALALGDFRVRLGQGLVLWQGGVFGNGAGLASAERSAPVLAPHRSAAEYGFCRGLGLSFQKRNWELSLFASRRRWSSTADSTGLFFSGLQTSGYHRTEAELRNRNNLVLGSGGGSLSFRRPRFRIALNAAAFHFSRSWQKQPEPYNRFAFTGRELVLASVDVRGNLSTLHFFGEAATDPQRHGALIAGLVWSPHPRLDLSLVARALSPQYHAPFGQAFTKGILPENERGLSASFVLRPAASWLLEATADSWTFPWLRYRTDAPSRGREYALRCTYTPAKSFQCLLRVQVKNEWVNGEGGALHPLMQESRSSWRVQCVEVMSRSLELRCRIELTRAKGEGEEGSQGFLAYTEALFSALKKWRGNLRLSWFEAEDWDSRIYTYEAGLPGHFSIPAVYGRGLHFYGNLGFQASRRWRYSLRWAQRFTRQVHPLHSASEADFPDSRPEIGVQLQMSL